VCSTNTTGANRRGHLPIGRHVQLRDNWIIWSLLSALFAGATAILAKVGIAGVDSNLATAIRTSVILLFTWAIVFSTSTAGGLTSVAPRTWLFLVLSGLATGLSWLCYFRALQLGQASRVAPIDKLSVAFVIVFAVVFLGERLTMMKLFGGSLIVVGAIILALE
jgi:transporter family protein